MKENLIINGKKIDLKLIEEKDIENYYERGFNFFDEEVMKCTGTKSNHTKEEVRKYVSRIVKDEDRYDFLILNKDKEIIGESVLNEIDKEVNSCNFRICLFKTEYCGKGLGKEAIELTIKYGFEKLKLNRIELEVYDFNNRAYKAYKNCGFIEEGIKREAEIIDGEYCDIIIMSILGKEYNKK